MKPIAILSALTLTVAAETPESPLRDLLRDGLYAEEVANDPATATKDYEQILARFEEQRPLAANALFRLAELYRKTERKDEAIALYQRVLAQFPDATPQAALARTRLTTLGIQAPAAPQDGPPAPEPADDEETKEIRRLSDLAKTSPDLLKPEREIAKNRPKGLAQGHAFSRRSPPRQGASGSSQPSSALRVGKRPTRPLPRSARSGSRSEPASRRSNACPCRVAGPD